MKSGGGKMKCPNCENEMEKGFVQSNTPIFFCIKKHKLHITRSSDDIRLTNADFDVPNVEAWCCKKCKKVIMDY